MNDVCLCGKPNAIDHPQYQEKLWLKKNNYTYFLFINIWRFSLWLDLPHYYQYHHLHINKNEHGDCTDKANSCTLYGAVWKWCIPIYTPRTTIFKMENDDETWNCGVPVFRQPHMIVVMDPVNSCVCVLDIAAVIITTIIIDNHR